MNNITCNFNLHHIKEQNQAGTNLTNSSFGVVETKWNILSILYKKAQVVWL